MTALAAYWATVLVAFAAFWLSPARLRLGVLVGVSVAYLTWLSWSSLLGCLALAGVFYVSVPWSGSTGWRRWVVPALAVGALSWLGYHKYLPPILDALFADGPARQIALPIGISYFTFRLVHYAIEASRGRIEERSFVTFLAWILLFPIYTAGPIERFDHFLANREHQLARADVAAGLIRCMHGLIKKHLLADVVMRELFVGWSTPRLLDELGTTPVWWIWTFMLLTYLWVYLDFSSYSDIAIGTCRLFGFRITENFDWPILAPNIGAFWKRWHMSLVAWCQAYVYMPTIGLTRRPYVAVYSTFIAMGLWHGGSPVWVCWGAYHATGVAIYQTWTRYRRKRRWKGKWIDGVPGKAAGWALTLVFLLTSYSFTTMYGVGTAADGARVLGAMFGVR